MNKLIELIFIGLLMLNFYSNLKKLNGGGGGLQFHIKEYNTPFLEPQGGFNRFEMGLSQGVIFY